LENKKEVLTKLVQYTMGFGCWFLFAGHNTRMKLPGYVQSVYFVISNLLDMFAIGSREPTLQKRKNKEGKRRCS